MDFSLIAESLAEKSYCVLPAFLKPDFVRDVQNEMKSLFEKEAFVRAAIGKSMQRHQNDEIRKDWTKWFESTEFTPTQKKISDLIEGLRVALNQELFLSLVDWEGHYAIYPVGAFYRNHLDRFKDDSKRTVSIVLYFNDDWDLARDGGALRIYPPTESEPIDILPEAGTLICFLSDRISHEVLVTRRERWSFAGWLKTRS